ncbi:MAG TPA: M20/M25/M40 family metallo-hydrolase [Pyrinomonadaceae bacterium]|nr:M20/M25/M40 family metallo-hydrolase [Pyrinomonadaceae bacterium]
MLYKNNLRTLLLAILLSSVALAQQPVAVKPAVVAVEVERLRAHVTHLASPKLEGRKTGTKGADEAADYIAAEFEKLSLAPGGGAGAGPRNEVGAREYLQRFPYVAGVELGKGNELEFTVRDKSWPPVAIDFRVGADWVPLGFSANASVREAPVVFVGYGISAADQNYDDYKDADARDKIALALAGTPDGNNPHGRFTRAGELRFKAAAARAAGAKALVVIASEANFKDDKLSRLSYDNAGGDAGLPVAVVSRGAGARMLGRRSVEDLSQFEEMARVLKSPASIFKEAADIGRMPPGMLSITTDVVRKEAPAANVVGVLKGSDEKLKDEVIVVGAHYDHLGHGGRGSLAGREGGIHHGADDNASGTAAIIELARVLSAERARVRRTVVFIAFGGEEEGLLGSSHYVKHPAAPLEKTVAMINLDMVGRLRGDALMIGGVGTASEWRAMIEEANNALEVKVVAASLGGGATQSGTAARDADDKPAMPIVTGVDGRVVATATATRRFNLRLNEDGFGPSDHSSFYAKRIPVLFFFTGTHEDYHKPSDTADRINYDGLAAVAEFVRRVLSDLQASDRRPTFAVAKTEAGARSTGFTVSLGTVPSYGESTDGMKLDAVRAGSPAEAAGLKAGDKIVKLAGRDVRNVYDYTQALSAMKAGETYEVEVVREGARLTMKVTPAARK